MIYLLVAIGISIIALLSMVCVFGIRYNKWIARYFAIWHKLSPLQEDAKVGWYISLLKPVTQREFFLNPRQIVKALRSGDTTGIVHLTPISLDEHFRAGHGVNDDQAGQIASLLEVRNSLARIYRQAIGLMMLFVLFLMFGAVVVFVVYAPG